MKLDQSNAGSPAAGTQTLEIPIQGMDCADCTRHVQQAIAALPGVESVQVLLASEKAVIRLDPACADLPAIRSAVARAGYCVPEHSPAAQAAAPRRAAPDFTRQVLTLLGIAFGLVLFVAVAGEGFGLFETITDLVPLPIDALLVLIAGYPIFRNVVRAARNGRVIAHTLMSIGAVAALAIGQWATALVVVFFMRVGEYVEHFTSERARRAVRGLTALAPQTARVERDGREQEVPVADVQVGETIVVRPGEQIPVDGEVLSGQATVDQAAITGESLPVEAGPGATVFAAAIAQLGSLRVRVTHVGADTTFGRVIRLVEEAEAQRASVQRLADTFSACYLPVVAVIAALTFLLRRDPLATAAVLVVACSCSFALATPIAMLASIGAAARRGLLIKGGKYLEALAHADVLLVDKTGTLTPGRPQITNVIALNGIAPDQVLALAAAAERYSEHPLAEAVRAAAGARNLTPVRPESFRALPGLGVRALVEGRVIEVGSGRFIEHRADPDAQSAARELEAQGKTPLFVVCDGRLAGVLGASDTVRPEIAGALRALRRAGIRQIEMLTGDNERTAAALAGQIGVPYRAGLLPEEKIAIVREYQAQGHTVVMIGDGVNDAPALAQADVGIAMGAMGADIALEAAHIALLRDDWMLVPEVLQIARRTMRVVRLNIAFTAIYNLAGLTLAALGFLPPIFAAAAQSLPDIGILTNSSRLLRPVRQRDAGAHTPD